MHWYDKKWVIWLFIILLWPVGLIMMWRTSNFGLKTKIIVTAVFVLLIFTVSKNPPEKSSISPQDATVQVQQQKPVSKQYAAVDANTMMNDLERNAAAAQQKYKGQLICVTGRIGVIDSNGDYILIQSDNTFAINGIMCYLNRKDKEQINILMQVQKGQYIRAYGEINDVGEVMGYSLKVDKFEI